MGSVTAGRFKLYKPAGNEFVDPVLNMQNNFNILDTDVFNFVRYGFYTSVLPNNLKIDGKKVYDAYTGKLKFLTTLNNVDYNWYDVPRSNNTRTWTTIPLISPYVSLGNAPDVVAWRYTDAGQTHVELRGKFYNGSGGALVNNAITNFVANGTVPVPAYDRCFYVTPNVSAANPANNAMGGRINVNTTGGLSYLHFGTNNATTDNFMSLDNIVYAI